VRWSREERGRKEDLSGRDENSTVDYQVHEGFEHGRGSGPESARGRAERNVSWTHPVIPVSEDAKNMHIAIVATTSAAAPKVLEIPANI
jgi:hypothetical protein